MRTLYFDKAIALYQNGSSVKDIANQFPVCAGTVALGVHEYKRTHPENYSKTLKETYYGEAIRLNKEKALIPVRSAKLCGALTHEKHRGGLPCGWGCEAPKEHWRIT